MNRTQLLEATSNGLDVFRRYLNAEPRAGHNFQNPFLTEKQETPSFNVYSARGTGEWRFRDFATADQGSCLDLVMKLRGLDVSDALAHLAHEFGLEFSANGNPTPPLPTPHVERARSFEPHYRETFTNVELSYWQAFGIGPYVLEKFDVRPILQYTASKTDGTRYTLRASDLAPRFAYDAGNGFVKVYSPLASRKAHKFAWPTGQPVGYVFGLAQLSEWHPLILLAAGEKDAMALSAHGYAAVTVGSETAPVSTDLIAQLRGRCDEVLVCYDADETGRRRSAEIAAQHGLRSVEWPPELLLYGKDAAEFYRAVYQGYLPANLLMDAINNAPAPVTTLPIESDDVLAESTLPGFEPAIYEALPDFLQRACAPFEGHEKAVMLIGSLGVLSGCFPGIGGTYDQRIYSLNLFTFIIAPAASGKGTMTWAKRLARPYHKQLVSESKCRRSIYEAELHACKATGKGNASAHLPAGPPPRQQLFIPGDITAAALMGALADNNGRGIIFENEADTLTAAMGGEHGKFGDKLCKIFQHEPVPLMRKGGDLYLELERPTVSIVLSGTRAQLPRLMPTAENGLISRFLFYTFEQDYLWRSGAPGGRPSLEPYFTNLSTELSKMIAGTPGPDEEDMPVVDFTLSAADWQRLNKTCEMGLHEAVDAAGEAGASSAYRLGLIVFRIIGLLTVLRCFENGEAPAGRVEADAKDVITALRIMDIGRAHALHVLDTLPRPSTRPMQLGTKRAEKLGKRLQAHALRAQGMSVRNIAEEVGASKSSVQEWLGDKVA